MQNLETIHKVKFSWIFEMLFVKPTKRKALKISLKKLLKYQAKTSSILQVTPNFICATEESSK